MSIGAAIMKHMAEPFANLPACLLRDGVRVPLTICFIYFRERLAGLTSTLLVVPIQSRGLEYRNTVRFWNQRQVNK